MNDQLVCTVAGTNYYGSEDEYRITKLSPGDMLIVNGTVEVIEYIWLYGGIVVTFKSGNCSIPSLADDKYEFVT